MKKHKIIFLKGLPASGKSTYACELINNNPGQYKRVNKDGLRLLLDNGKRSKNNEKFVLKTEEDIIKNALKDGYDVIVDSTNFAPIHEQRMNNILDDLGRDKYSMEIKFFDVPFEECVYRDSKRETPVGRKVIEEMYHKYIHKERKPRKEIEGLPQCIIFDIDGTLAKKGDRDIYDDTKLYVDTVIPQTKMLNNLLYNNGWHIVIMSGRMDTCQQQTEKWLKDNGILYHQIYMRHEGDIRKDSIIKEELYKEYIENKYNVFAIIDDRKQVVSKRREMGLYVFEVNQGEQDF